jgi:integrase/recombinase XerD
VIVIGTDLEIIQPLRTDIAGGDAQRLPSLHTSVESDLELLAVWIKSHADGSVHTRRAHDRIGRRFVEALGHSGSTLRRATIDDVQAALEVMRLKQNDTPASAVTVTTTIAAVKAFLGFAHQVGYTRFNASPSHQAQKGDGEAQLALVGKGDKPRHVLLPAETAKLLIALLGEVAPSARLFPIMERRINYILKAIPKRAKCNPNISPHWLRHTHASHAIDNGAPITLVSHTLGHADLKTTSVSAHARPNESSSRFLNGSLQCPQRAEIS